MGGVNIGGRRRKNMLESDKASGWLVVTKDLEYFR